LDNPPPVWLRKDGTVLVKLVDATAEFGKVVRNRTRTGLAAKVPRTCQRWWTKPSKLYVVMPAKEGYADVFPAYICPYADNATHFRMLGADAAVMFTGDMDGCTFGVGVPNADGGVRVGHANAQIDAVGDDPTGAQRQSQRDNLARGGLTRLVDPDE